MDLFRSEAIEHRASRLLGEISLAQPVAWSVAAALIVAAVAGAALALVLVHVPRVVRLPAVIEQRGVRLIVPDAVAIGMTVRVRPEIVGAQPDEIVGPIAAVAQRRTVARIGSNTIVGRVARVEDVAGAIPDGTIATATVVIGREPLGAALF